MTPHTRWRSSTEWARSVPPGLDAKLPVTPQDRFAPVPPEQRDLVEVWLQPRIAVTNETAVVEPEPEPADARIGPSGPVEVDQVKPHRGTRPCPGASSRIGPAREELVVRFWANMQVIHLSIGGARAKGMHSDCA